MKDKEIILLGFMGSGKSEVGRRLAQELGIPFVDMDEEIEKREGRTIGEIFKREGEDYFRRKEGEILKEIICGERKVVSTGGGVVINPENWKILRKGITIYLEIGEEEAYQRLKNVNDRPLLWKKDRKRAISRLLSSRRVLYEQADFKVNTEKKDFQEIVEEIKEILKVK